MSAPEVDSGEFEYGDWVESRLNADVYGIVVGWDIWKNDYDVMLVRSLTVMRLPGATLIAMANGDEVDPDEPKRKPESNVVVLDDVRAKRAAGGVK